MGSVWCHRGSIEAPPTCCSNPVLLIKKAALKGEELSDIDDERLQRGLVWGKEGLLWMELCSDEAGSKPQFKADSCTFMNKWTAAEKKRPLLVVSMCWSVVCMWVVAPGVVFTCTNLAATSLKPLCSKRLMISPHSPLWTPSGFTAMKVRSMSA